MLPYRVGRAKGPRYPWGPMRRSITLLFLLSVASVFAQAPYLVKDLGNASGATSARSSDPRAFLDSGGKLFFVATSETNGLEPWVHDAGGTRFLRDINGGTAGSNVTLFMELTPGVVIFTANDGVNGTQLWRSDGTEAGTTLLKIVNATASGFLPTFSYGGKVFFSVDDGVHGREPWVTDGTSEGTQLLVETGPGTAGNGAGNFFRFGNTTRFFALGGIWSTDGTPTGTTLDILLESYRFGVAVVGNAFYFFGYDSVHGMEPWKSDGTAAGTSMIKEIRSGVASYSISIAPTTSGAVFFADDGTGGGGRLWTTDGTAANTVPLDAFPATGTTNFTAVLYPTTSGVFFDDGDGGWKVWRTNGTQAGTYIATTTVNGAAAFGFIEAFSKIYFTSWVGSSLYLFQTDGSANAPAVNVLPDLPAKNVTFTGGKLWFAGRSAANGTELYVSHDGAALGTQLIANLAPDPDPSSRPENFKASGPYLYFHPMTPRELWRSDGTSGGTVEVTEMDSHLLAPAPFGSLTPFRGDMYFHHGHTGFYRVDGVNGGATKIGDYQFDAMTADENTIYMWAWSSRGIFTSDGTVAGTIPLYDPNDPGHFLAYDSVVVLPYDGYSWIRCYHGLFRTAGTVATTHRVASMPEYNTYLTGWLAGAGGLVYSGMFSSTNGIELWRSDGTAAGSFVVKDANPGAASSNPSNLTPAGRLLFFTATAADHGTELWRTDGTAAGTFMLKDIRPGTESSQPSALASLGEVVYFAANDGTTGIELWKSDGTTEGTVLVRDLAPGVMSSKPAWLAAAGGKIWFSANDGLHGYELWSTDGTENGTELAGDIIPGSSSSSPDQMTAAESTLFFTAMTDVEGRELWAMPLTMGYASVTGGRTAEGNSGTRALRFTIQRHGVSTGAASVAYAILAGTATAGADYSPAAGTIHFSAGETVKTVDVTIHGDTATEANETLFLQLSSPSGVALQDAIAAGVIDDDDPRADLAAELLQNASSYEASRMVRVTNHGPSNAAAITVTFTESPYEFIISVADGITCTETMPVQCTIAFLQPSESRTLQIYRSSIEGLVDPALPPGRTVTVQVSSSSIDPNLSNNTASVMTTGNGMLQLPSQLVIGTSATATFDLGTNATSPTDVTLTSSSTNVLVTPATVRIEAGQRTAAFTLATTVGADKTLLTATIAAETQAALVAPIVANGQSPKLDVAIVAETKSTLGYGELFIIPVRVAARYPDGTVPAGLVTLLDQDGTTLSQLTLDTEGATTFTRPQPAPGDYHYRVRYDGDARFNALTVSLPTITIQKAPTTGSVQAPTLSCSNTVEFRLVVNGLEGAPVPTGSVTLSSFPNSLGTFTLAPNGLPDQSEATATLTFANGSRSITASYSGDVYYAGSIFGKSFSVGCAAMSLVATATSPTSVALSWVSPAQTTSHYEVYRADSIEGLFQWIASTTGLSAVDTTAQQGRVYLYSVGVYGAPGTPSYSSNVDIASTFVYTDHPLAAGTSIKSAHLTELRSMVAALRNTAGLSPLTFTGSVSRGSVVQAQHITELRSSIDASRARLGLPAIGWTQQNAANGALIRAATLQELRGAPN